MKKILLPLFISFVLTITVSAQLKKQYRQDFIASAKIIPSYSSKVYVPDSLKLTTRDTRKSWFFLVQAWFLY